jgi:hypothetical protein
MFGIKFLMELIMLFMLLVLILHILFNNNKSKQNQLSKEHKTLWTLQLDKKLRESFLLQVLQLFINILQVKQRLIKVIGELLREIFQNQNQKYFLKRKFGKSITLKIWQNNIHNSLLFYQVSLSVLYTHLTQ